MKRYVLAAVLVLSVRARADEPNLEPSVENDGPSAIDPADMFQQYNNARRGSAPSQPDTRLETSVNTQLGWAQWGINTMRSWGEFDRSFPTLTAFDASCMDLSTLGAPQLPASCTDATAGCGKCYIDAERSLDGMRINLERLKCYYAAYKRFVDASLAFGDSASGIHAVTGLEWQTQRAVIVQEMDNLKQAYDHKFHDMLPNLQSALQKIGDCEAQYFNNPDWYARFGNLYFAFMADRYKRTD